MEFNGLGQGIVQGMQMATQGMIQAEDLTNKRQQVQQEAAKTQAYLQTQGMQQQNYDLQIQQNQQQLNELNKQIAKRDTWDVLSGYENTRDASVLNTIKENPIMANLLNQQGITGFSNIKDLSEEKRAQLGLTQDLLDDPTKRIVIATTADGRQVPINMMGIYATTGYLPKLGEQKLQEMTLQSTEAKANIEQLKYKDMTNWLANNPNGSLADYMAHMKSKTDEKPAFQKEVEYLRQNYGEDVAKTYIDKKVKAGDNTPATIQTEKVHQGQINTIKAESKVENLYDVDYNKLSPDNKTIFDGLVKQDAKNIKPEEYDALASLEAAADKLNPDELASTTGIADATFNKVFDTLGLDLPDKTLVQSANYNILKNMITRANAGTQVTGNELERMTAQIGNEFKSDKTVRIKTAETLDNLAAKYEGYKVTAPALYARSMKNKVDNLKMISNYLRNPESGKQPKGSTDKPTSTSQYQIGQVVTNTKNNTKWQFLGGDATDQKNWKKVSE